MRHRPLLVSRAAMLGLILVAVLLVLVACMLWGQGTMPKALTHSYTSVAARALYQQAQHELGQAQGLLRLITMLVCTIGLLLLALCARVLWNYRQHVVPELRAHNAALVTANTRLEALATTDPLTGLPNHRALVAALDHEVGRAHRYGRPCAVLFLDLDHFKALNDAYGHTAGDTALRELAGVVRSTLRGVDLLGRWGGEEFVALLPETDAAGALDAAERVRAAVAACTLTVGGGTHLTCSLGIAAYPHNAEDRDSLVAAADQAMYVAKCLGRNQVRAASDPAVAALQTAQRTGDSREETALAGTVEALAMLVAVRDCYTGQHTQEVARLAVRLALALGLNPAEARMVGLAGRLHDLGKVAVPDAVLQKRGHLTAEEWALVHRHPGVGADVVSRVPALRALAPLIRAHHERWDGRGYPEGLAGEAIPLGGRIVGVANAYAAMMSDRPYRRAAGAAWALEEVRRAAGTRFDPTVVAALERVLAADGALDEHAGRTGGSAGSSAV
jgi:diguanylate cyclase (GGDEF)-like protein